MNPTKQIGPESYEAPVLTDIAPISIVRGDDEASPNGNEDEPEPGSDL